MFGRGRGIRTPGPREGSPVFKTGAINRSTIPLYRFFALRTAKLTDYIILAKKGFDGFLDGHTPIGAVVSILIFAGLLFEKAGR